ncbi:aromatic amino acid transport family protein, partial [Klebsiella pneumoniae]
MSENSTFSPVLTGRERTAVPAKSLSFVEGVSMIVGTNIGAGVLSIAYASSKAGFLPLLFWLVLVGSLTTVTMLYVAESTLRTRKHLQLSGLSKRYVGGFGALMMFLSVCVNSVGALTAYMTGSGKLLHSLFGISPALAEDIKIAVVGAMSGPVAQYRDQEFTGAEQAVADINAKGGIKGNKLQIVKYDDACDPKQAVAVANKVVNDGIKYV